MAVYPEEGRFYRIYVLVNRQTVVADEDVGYKSYPHSVEEGNTIEIQAYCDMNLTVTLKDLHRLVETETAKHISIEKIVPAV